MLKVNKMKMNEPKKTKRICEQSGYVEITEMHGRN